jgi:glycosyltransferase involved in cell wall biosynthesis
VRVVLDLQSLFAPTTARRGIGFYSLQLALAMCRDARGHEVHLLLAATGDDAAVVAVREAFRDLVPHSAVHVLEPVLGRAVPPADHASASDVSEALREGLLASLEPDAVLVTSLFELGPDFPTTVDRWTSGPPTAVVLYDLMPLEEPDVLLADRGVRARYLRALEDLGRASVLLAISEHSRDRATALLDPCPTTTAIYGAAIPADADGPGGPPPGVDGRSVVLCVGGDHPRKNMAGLVRAWGRVAPALRRGRILVLACEVSGATQESLRRTAQEAGLRPEEVLVTGFVSAAVLDWLYDAAELFVFPSFSEGLGLPALEAMEHGCPVLVADATSLRELVPDPAARFDPADPVAMAACIERALGDAEVLEQLRQQSREQAALFTWQRTAALAWDAVEGLSGPPVPSRAAERRRLAVVSPWPPVRSGVADYAAATTAALCQHYDVTAVGEPVGLDGVGVVSREEFRRTWQEYDRVLYHVGNSPYHTADMAALPEAPGVVLLHDSTLAGTLRFAGEPLGHPAGVEALLRESSPRQHSGDDTDQRGLRAVLSGAVAVHVHSPHAAAEIARAGFGQAPVAVVPHPVLEASAAPVPAPSADGRLLVGHFGFVHSFKQPELLLKAAALAAERLAREVEVVFVGAVSDEAYQAVLTSVAAGHGVRVRFLGYVGLDELAAWTATVDCAVQLRSVSHGESSGSVTRLLAAGRPTVVSDLGSFRDLPRDVVRHHPPGGSAELLAQTLVDCLSPEVGVPMGERAAAYAAEFLSLDAWARGTRDALELAYDGHPAVRGAVALRTAARGASKAVLTELTRVLVEAAGRRPSASSVIASDVSVLAVTPFLTGIQRVTLSLHRELSGVLGARGAGLVAADVAPATVPRSPHPAIAADPVLGGVEVRVSDAEWLLCLDLDFGLSVAEPVLLAAKALGTRVLVNVYDLLIVTNPEWFVPRAAETVFLPWLHSVVKVADVITVNSRATADALRAWVAEHAPERSAGLRVAVLPLGVDLPPGCQPARPRMGRPRLAIVGTIEPRKGHDDLLKAVDRLWAAGLDLDLTLVGRQGWLVEDLVERLTGHPELGRRLRWLASADDEALQQVLAETDCMVVASRDEGFGLPVVEAAAHGIPLVVRDVPVFREVAGDGATYFSGGPAELAEVLDDWVRRWRAGERLAAGEVAVHSWSDVARLLVEVLDAQDR